MTTLGFIIVVEKYSNPEQNKVAKQRQTTFSTRFLFFFNNEL